MFWGLYYQLPGAVYLYLGITATIYLAGTFVSVLGGSYWKRASTAGGYPAMVCGAAGAIIPYFFLHWSENITGLCAFGLATEASCPGVPGVSAASPPHQHQQESDRPRV